MMESFRPDERALGTLHRDQDARVPEVRLLLTSAGRRVELMKRFQRQASSLGIKLRTFACDLDPELSPACRLADEMFRVSAASSASYIDELLRLCVANRITMVVPTIDPELQPLSLARSEFAAIGTEVVVSGAELVGIARDKLATAGFLAAAGIPSPRTARLEDVLSSHESWSWPLLVKPRHGSASRGIRIAASPAELPRHATEPLLAQELVSGREFTVNMFFDRKGQLRAAVPHERLRVRAGEVEKGVTRRIGIFEDIAARLAATLPCPRGPMCFQAFLTDSGEACVFEINARLGGGYPLADEAGAPFTRWLLQEQADLPSSACNQDWREGVIMLRYDAAVFVS